MIYAFSVLLDKSNFTRTDPTFKWTGIWGAGHPGHTPQAPRPKRSRTVALFRSAPTAVDGVFKPRDSTYCLGDDGTSNGSICLGQPDDESGSSDQASYAGNWLLLLGYVGPISRVTISEVANTEMPRNFPQISA